MPVWSKIAVGLIALLVGGYLGYMNESKTPGQPSKIAGVLDPPKIKARPGGGPNVGVAN